MQLQTGLSETIHTSSVSHTSIYLSLSLCRHTADCVCVFILNIVWCVAMIPELCALLRTHHTTHTILILLCTTHRLFFLFFSFSRLSHTHSSALKQRRLSLCVSLHCSFTHTEADTVKENNRILTEEKHRLKKIFKK